MTIQPLAFGQYYHIYNRGNNRENIFIEPRNYPYFLKLYGKHIQPVASTFAYCLMANHFHLLIRTRTEDEQYVYWQENVLPYVNKSPSFRLREPSIAFRNLFIAYARAVNRATGRTGALFQRPFGRKLVTSDVYFQILVVYIHRNPQKHGFVDDYRDWRWSSHSSYQTEQSSQLERTAVIKWFGDKAGFDEAHCRAVDEKRMIDLIIDES